ncbi:glycosyltransferase family 2 protein [Ligilactobacillus salivarius]|uniref:glycosyltransferase family 2 protein n=1 Tax=Ligilactobacillus salivarius TaxID=1624 RepID=UPI00191FEFFC|nr:glycosyltransferase family 2 protein [Ligilactobacillus salivarius]MBL1057235.1 glycosyltransferase family 2 protein [Ligilactobacillus salivarius]
MMDKNYLTIVVPCYNEEEVLPETVKELGEILNKLIQDKLINQNSKILFVDDGSKDNTWNLIKKYEEINKNVTGIKFSRNYGHQNALIAGMTVAVKKSDMIITIDADLQDDVNAIFEMVRKYHEGIDVVYGVRNSRETDTVFKRRTALAFYKLMEMLGVNMVPNSADYRLLSKRAVEGLLEFHERNIFLRGMVPLVGYRSDKVYYARKERFAGTSKYPLKKMIKFAMDGITSFSTVPIKLIMNLGLLLVVIGIILFVYTIVQKILGHVNAGWSSLMVSIWVLGGVQLICLSIIGEYVGKIFTEVKQRPRYTLEEDDYSEVKSQEQKNDKK